MKALILNSGLGSRMGVLTSEHPKCMTEISSHETILSRQLTMIAEAGIEDVVMTTGYYDGILVQYCRSLAGCGGRRFDHLLNEDSHTIQRADFIIRGGAKRREGGAKTPFGWC